jgi:hypothetical protein
MKKIFLLITLLMSASIISAEPFSQPILETYTARISPKDHFNSKGHKLTSVAEIIRQDRANFHNFNLKDIEDQADIFFVSKVNRGLLAKMLANGITSKETKETIINGSPIITVTVYKNHINISLK